MKLNVRWLLSALLVAGGLALLNGCESKETDDMAKAQQCLDNISSTNHASAANCLSYIDQYDSAQANILKCSIKFLAGGLTTDKIISAYKQLSTGSATNKEMVFMTVLALSPSTLATDAQTYCARSEDSGLVYLANLAVMGSMMADTIATLPGATYDPNDPSYTPPSPTEISNLLGACQPPSVDVNCTSKYATIGAAAATVAAGYCTGDQATSEVCTKVNSAISGANGDSTLIAKQLFCALDNKTYSAGPPEGCL